MTANSDADRIAVLEQALANLMQEFLHVQRAMTALNDFAVDLDRRLTTARVLKRDDSADRPAFADPYRLHVEPIARPDTDGLHLT